MYVSPEETRPLPIQRAFVVQLHAEAEVAQGRIIGRVEHVLSGQVARFQTLDELPEFFTHLLRNTYLPSSVDRLMTPHRV